jgi:hypothetical protein
VSEGTGVSVGTDVSVGTSVKTGVNVGVSVDWAGNGADGVTVTFRVQPQ